MSTWIYKSVECDHIT